MDICVVFPMGSLPSNFRLELFLSYPVFFSVHVRLPATAGGIFEELLCATNGGEFGAGIFCMERGNAVRFSGRFFSGERPLSF